MFEPLIPYMRCPRCMATPLLGQAEKGLLCTACNTPYPIRDGILDLLAGESREIITPFQRIMQTPVVVSIYEQMWRKAGYFLASSRSFDAELQTVLSHAQGKGEGRVLDLACGTGVFTRPLARLGTGMVIGFDLSWPMLRRAAFLVRRERIENVLLIHGTVFHLPFIEGAFPYINCCGALHLFNDVEQALKEIERVLQPGGHLCVQTTLRPDRSWGFSLFLERFIRFGFFDEAELRDRFQGRRLKILQSEQHRISFTALARHI